MPEKGKFYLGPTKETSRLPTGKETTMWFFRDLWRRMQNIPEPKPPGEMSREDMQFFIDLLMGGGMKVVGKGLGKKLAGKGLAGTETGLKVPAGHNPFAELAEDVGQDLSKVGAKILDVGKIGGLTRNEYEAARYYWKNMSKYFITSPRGRFGRMQLANKHGLTESQFNVATTKYMEWLDSISDKGYRLHETGGGKYRYTWDIQEANYDEAVKLFGGL
jgi:hypothetical protein